MTDAAVLALRCPAAGAGMTLRLRISCVRLIICKANAAPVIAVPGDRPNRSVYRASTAAPVVAAWGTLATL